MPRALKGMVLAAGLGTRLRPLTDLYPKPLVPFAGTTPLELALGQLDAAGITEVAVNSHYHPEQIAQVVAQRPFGLQLTLSYEAELLGTGGAYSPLRTWLGDADLVVLNGDVVADFDLAALISTHRGRQAVATMMLLPSVIAGESAVFHANGQIKAIGKTAPAGSPLAGNFACAQVLSSQLLDLLPKSGASDIIAAAYQIALKNGWPVAAQLHDGYWHDLRTPQFYWAALRALLVQPELATAVGVTAARQRRGLEPLPNALGVLLPVKSPLGASSQIAASAEIGPHVVVEAGVEIGAEAKVRESVLLPGAVVPPGAICERVIIGPSLRVVLL